MPAAVLLLAGLLAGCLGGTDPAELPLSEDFSRSCEWPTTWSGVERGECADGVYRFELAEPGGPYTAWREVEPSSFAVEVEGTFNIPLGGGSADLHGFGVGCWDSIGGSGFLFMLQGDGRVIVFEEHPASGLVPIFEETTPLPGYRLPARLGARCAGGRGATTLSFSVNGVERTLPETARPVGAFSVIGFAAATGDAKATIVVDDLAARRA